MLIVVCRLHAAILGGDTDIVNFVISAGGNVVAKNLKGSVSLHYACYWGDKEMIQPILKASRDPNPRNKNGTTPLHLAAEANQVESIQRLFEECDKEGLQLDVNSHDNWGCSPLMRALESRRIQAAELLLKKGTASTARHDGSYPIHIAAWYGYVKIVEILLNYPGVDCKNLKDRLPLHYAAASGKVALIQLFIDHFAEQLNVQDKFGHTPVMLALRSRHIEATNYLLDHQTNLVPADQYGKNMVHLIARYGDLNLLRRAIAMGYDATAQAKNASTALMIAIECSNMDMFDELLKIYPESWTVADSLGKTCLHLSAAEGNLELLMRLQRMGADVKSRDLLGRSPLLNGASEGHLHIVKYLYSQGCPINDFEDGGWTPLMSAVERGYLPLVEYLLEHYALEDVNRIQRYSHRSAMTEAGIADFGLLYTMLKKAGGDPFQRGALGYRNIEHRFLASRFELDTNVCSLAMHYGLENIQRYCNMLKHITEVSIKELYSHLDLLTILAEGLRCQGDWDFARLCLMELRWGDEFAVLAQEFFCAICNSKQFDGDMYVCKECLSEITICGVCHEKYLKNGQKGPAALHDLRNIEEKLRAIRMAIPECFGLEETMQVAYHFGTESWIYNMVKSYESWELNHNANNVYDALTRPGHQFVKILSSARELEERVLSADAFSKNGADTEIWLKMCDQFKSLKRKHPVGQLQRRFCCSGHGFFVASGEERDRLVTEGIKLDSKYGRITDVVYEELRAKYPYDPDSAPSKSMPALPDIPPIPKYDKTQISEEAPSSLSKGTGIRLMESLNQLTSTLDQDVSPEKVEAMATEYPAQTQTPEDSDLVGEFPAITIDHSHSKLSSSHDRAVVPSAIKRLRVIYLDLHPTIIPDHKLWLWAVAVQIAELADPGFEERYKNERLAIMAEGDHNTESRTTT